MERDSSTSPEPRPTLSICISTINRAEFLRVALESILPQITEECEVLVVDNASTDNTAQVVSELMRGNGRLRYIKQDTNNGLDSNFNRAVELSQGSYCWINSDDDVMKPGAIAAVLRALRQEPSAVIVNFEYRDFTLRRIVQPRVLDFDTDRTYGPWESERMFVELGDSIRYVGTLVMKRTIWISSHRTLYVGSYYAFVGLFYREQLPSHVYVISHPYMSYRVGNAAEFSSHQAEIIFAKWPSVVTSLPFSYRSKRRMSSSEPWKHFYDLLIWRAMGAYSYDEYRRWIRPRLRLAIEKLTPVTCALLPRFLAALMLILFMSPRAQKLRQLDGWYLAEIKLRNPFGFFRFSTDHKATAREPINSPRMTQDS